MATKTEKKNKVTKNLEIAISQIEKAHGPGSIKKIDDISGNDMVVISIPFSASCTVPEFIEDLFNYKKRFLFSFG